MESVMGMIKYWCHDFWEIYGDHRISHLPLLKGGPWHVIGLTLFYLYFVKVMGPRMMKDRPPYELRGIMLAHNTFLVLLNGIGFLVGMWGTNWGLDTLKCRPFDPSSPATQDRVLFYLGYTYYISKYIDFLDTVYFVLRKKYSHISPLHVFHHTMMPFWCYIFFKFSSYTNNGFIPLINAFVHTVMYSYYALSALGPHMKPYLWWKKYITQLQLVQFCFATVHSLYMFADQTCTCSKFLISLQAAHGILFLFLFGDFYKKSYNNVKSSSSSSSSKSSKSITSSKKVASKVN